MMEAVSGGRGSVVVEGGGGRVIRGFKISLDGIEGGTYNKLNRLIVHQANLFSKKKIPLFHNKNSPPKTQHHPYIVCLQLKISIVSCQHD